MTTLEKLPTELLQRIISLISTKDVAAISLQCRYLHTISDMASRRRYRRISVDYECWPRAYNLLWKFLKKPIMGALVKEISFDTYGFLHHYRWSANPDEKEVPLLRSAIKGAGFTGQKAEDLYEILMFHPKRLIHICYSKVSPIELRWIIRLPKALEEFKFSSDEPRFYDNEQWVYDGNDFGTIIFCHKSTLKVLDLDVDHCIEYLWFPGLHDIDHINDRFYRPVQSCENNDSCDFPTAESPVAKEQPDTRPYDQTIGSLHDFTAIKHLSIGVGVLLGPRANHEMNSGPENERAPIRLIDALPPNLEYLCIRGFVVGEDPGYTSKIEEFMAKKERWPPTLKEVHGIDECVYGLPVAQGLEDQEEMGSLDEMKNKNKVHWAVTEDDEWTDYADEFPPNLQEVPWIELDEVVEVRYYSELDSRIIDSDSE